MSDCGVALKISRNRIIVNNCLIFVSLTKQIGKLNEYVINPEVKLRSNPDRWFFINEKCSFVKNYGFQVKQSGAEKLS